MTQEVYLTYFDLLGFKEFINNNDNGYIEDRMSQIFRDMELSLTRRKTIFTNSVPKMAIPDLSSMKVNCINISDTVLYWTNDLNPKSLVHLFFVSYCFNQSFNLYNFPVRGCMTKGLVNHVMGDDKSSNDFLYSVRCLYGKGVVAAHNRAESQQWAGTVIDKPVMEDLQNYLYEDILNNYTIKYRVPYKFGDTGCDELVFKLENRVNDQTHLSKLKEHISSVFSRDNKSIENESVKVKLENTLKFLDYLLDITGKRH